MKIFMNGGNKLILLTYPNDDGTTTTIAYNDLITYKSKKIKGKFFNSYLYTIAAVIYGEKMIIKENLTHSELKEYMAKLKYYF